MSIYPLVVVSLLPVLSVFERFWIRSHQIDRLFVHNFECETLVVNCPSQRWPCILKMKTSIRLQQYNPNTASWSNKRDTEVIIGRRKIITLIIMNVFVVVSWIDFLFCTINACKSLDWRIIQPKRTRAPPTAYFIVLWPKETIQRLPHQATRSLTVGILGSFPASPRLWSKVNPQFNIFAHLTWKVPSPLVIRFTSSYSLLNTPVNVIKCVFTEERVQRLLVVWRRFRVPIFQRPNNQTMRSTWSDVEVSCGPFN